MIKTYDHISAANVISKKYYLNYNDFETAMEEFLDEISNYRINIKGFPFYSINGIPGKDKNIYVEFFVSTTGSYLEVPEGMRFHSYFNIEGMIAVTVFNDYEKNSEKAYEKLKKYMDENDLEQVTPVFNVIGGDDTLQYITLKVGIAK